MCGVQAAAAAGVGAHGPHRMRVEPRQCYTVTSLADPAHPRVRSTTAFDGTHFHSRWTPACFHVTQTLKTGKQGLLQQWWPMEQTRRFHPHQCFCFDGLLVYLSVQIDLSRNDIGLLSLFLCGKSREELDFQLFSTVSRPTSTPPGCAPGAPPRRAAAPQLLGGVGRRVRGGGGACCLVQARPHALQLREHSLKLRAGCRGWTLEAVGWWRSAGVGRPGDGRSGWRGKGGEGRGGADKFH